MLILLSPTKKQIEVLKEQGSTSLLFNEKKEHILGVLKSFSKEEIQERYGISDALSEDTYHRFQTFNEQSTALFTYVGAAFASLNPKDFSEELLNYTNDHLLIFSALYGLVRPLDRIGLYRLDLLTNLDFSLKNLWTDTITHYLNARNQPLVNLASQEFSALIDLNALTVPITNIVFLTRNKKGEAKVVSAHAKKARGAYAAALLKNPHADLKSLEILDYHYSHQEDNNLIFIKD